MDDNPWVSEIELSNWGEIFLNPDIERIIEYAYRRNVALSAWNGANFNHVRDSVLEAMVRYKFRAITCSIDGASGDIYELYRRNGDFGRVIDNLRKLRAANRTGTVSPWCRAWHVAATLVPDSTSNHRGATALAAWSQPKAPGPAFLAP